MEKMEMGTVNINEISNTNIYNPVIEIPSLYDIDGQCLKCKKKTKSLENSIEIKILYTDRGQRRCMKSKCIECNSTKSLLIKSINMGL